MTIDQPGLCWLCATTSAVCGGLRPSCSQNVYAEALPFPKNMSQNLCPLWMRWALELCLEEL